MSTPLSTFGRDTRGSVALMFGLVALVLVGVVGAAFDYSRMALTQTSLQRAVDGAALLAARNGDNTNDSSRSDALAESYLRNTFDVDQLSNMRVKVTMSNDRVRIDASGDLKMTITNVIGFRSMPVKSTAEALFGDSRVEIALVLDNTGSMGNLNKLDTLKTAAHRFLSKMQASTGSADAIKIAIVPFDTNVNLGSLQASAWVDPAAASAWAADPSKAGCIWDRDQPGDVSDTSPSGSSNLYGPDTGRASPCNLAPIMPLTNDFASLHARIDAMVVSGHTNTTIGLAWGYHILTPSEPVTSAAPFQTRLTKYIIFMTDGNNTQNRWSRSQTDIDARTRQVCTNIKKDKIQIFSARIIEGNGSLLTECASSPDMYYDVQDVAQLDPVFSKIYAQITSTRIAR